MSDNINQIPESIDNAIKNITDKPTLNIGTTLADIWFLIFGGISKKAEKKRLQIEKDIQDFRNELYENVERIPEDKRIDPDFQTVSLALENSKFSVNAKEIRNMFSTLIASSMNSDLSDTVHPSFAEMIKQMSPYDAKVAKQVMSESTLPVVKIRKQEKSSFLFHEKGFECFKFSTTGSDIVSHLTPINGIIDITHTPICLNNLERLGLVQITYNQYFTNAARYEKIRDLLNPLLSDINNDLKSLSQDSNVSDKNYEPAIIAGIITVTPLGHDFASVCFE